MDGHGHGFCSENPELQEHQADMVFVLRDTISPTHLIPGLQMDGNHVEVNLQMETNLPGCFACGDLAGKPVSVYQVCRAGKCGGVGSCRVFE